MELENKSSSWRNSHLSLCLLRCKYDNFLGNKRILKEEEEMEEEEREEGGRGKRTKKMGKGKKKKCHQH